MNLSSLEGLLLSQYLDSVERRFVRGLLDLGDAQFSRPLELFTHSIDDATGPFLDRIGALLGIERPPVSDTSVEHFGFAGEDVAFGRGLLAEHITTVGPTVPMDDTAYRRMLRARAITLTATNGIEDVARAARALFDQSAVSSFEREFPVEEVAGGPVFGLVAATGHDTRPVLPGAIDRGVILGLRNEEDRGGGSYRYSRVEINPNTGLVNHLVRPLEVTGVGRISGMSLWDETNSVLLFTRGGTPGPQGTGAFVLRLLEWSHESYAFQMDGAEPIKWEIPILQPDLPIRFPTGFGVGPPNAAGRTHYFSMWAGNPPTSRLMLSPTDPLSPWEPTNARNSFDALQVGVFPELVGSMVTTPDGLMVGDSRGIRQIDSIPDRDTDIVPLTLRYESSPGAFHNPTAAAYLAGRVVWYDSQTSRLYSDPLETRGFQVFGASTDGFYNEAVNNVIDQLLPRPAGTPMRVLMEVIENAP